MAVKRIYIAGPITGFSGYKLQFLTAERLLLNQGHAVMNPANMADGFTWEQYMTVALAMLSVCDAVYMLHNWRCSGGACIEHGKALALGMEIIYEAHPDDA